MTIQIENVSRRAFLSGTVATGGLVLAARILPALAQGAPKYGADGMPHGAVNDPRVFAEGRNVRIGVGVTF